MNDLRWLPSIEKLLQSPRAEEIITQYGRSLTLDSIRTTVEKIRAEYKQGQTILDPNEILERVEDRLAKSLQPTMIPVINATGVIIHTNLGRAPLAKSSLEAIVQTAFGYSNLEYDMEKGIRGTRSVHAEKLLKLITGAESALVVNNNAGAVLLVLAALTRGKRVVISRSQLVEIGGGFRVPDVMKQSGAKLVEVGTTNRVHMEDYENALQTTAGAILHAHASNFRLVGFTTEPPFEALVEIAHRYDIPMIDDLGSGALIDTAVYGLGHEPTVQESLRAGTDVICFSGDKLLGGPQAGIIIGREVYLNKIKKHPLARAMRADKLCLAGLSATLTHYLKEDYEEHIPIWMMIATPIDKIRTRAESWAQSLGCGEVKPGESTVGGGSLPGEILPTYLLHIKSRKPVRMIDNLRLTSPPIIARIIDDHVVFDPRTVLPDQDPALLSGIRSVMDS